MFHSEIVIFHISIVIFHISGGVSNLGEVGLEHVPPSSLGEVGRKNEHAIFPAKTGTPFFQQKRARHFSSKNGHAIFPAKTGTPVLQFLPFYPVSGKWAPNTSRSGG